MTAPVCHVSPARQIDQPPAGVLRLRSIPPVSTGGGTAVTMASMAAAIEALTYNMQLLSGQLQQRDTGIGTSNQHSGAPGPANHGGGGGVKPSPPKPGKNSSRFSETRRSTTQVKVENPDDPTQFVMVEQIDQLVLTDGVTGETWQWVR